MPPAQSIKERRTAQATFKAPFLGFHPHSPVARASCYESRFRRRISSCEPMNCTSSESGLSRMSSRRRKPARHSKTCGASFLIPIPAWTWGRPNTSRNSSRARQASSRSFRCSPSSRLMTAGVITNGFFKFFWSGVFDNDAAPLLQIPRTLLLEAPQSSLHLLRRHPIFFADVFMVHRHGFVPWLHPHLDRLQGKNSRARDNSDFFASRRRVEPFTEVLLRVRDRERLHFVHIGAIYGLYQVFVAPFPGVWR